MSTPVHPLEPLSADELRRAVAVLRSADRLSEAARFSCALPVEPDKATLRGGNGAAIERRVRLVGYDRELGASFDALISLSQDKLLDFSRVETGHAPISLADVARVSGITKADPRWQEAMRNRGIEDFDLVQIDPWPGGGFVPEGAPAGTRLMRAISFVHEDPDDNAYARPVEGLIAYVDLEREEVFRLDDHGVVPFPPEAGRYDAASVGPLRDDLRPVEITQPEGPSFEVDGHAIRWQKWQLRISLHPTHGLVLHDVCYEDEGRVRPILHRASLADMVVPYGDPSPMHAWKHVFDASEASIGHLANSLKLGCDCLGEIRYFDATFLGPKGEPFSVENAVCMHEEDYGVLWKHTNFYTQSTEVRRSRRLVISAIHTVGNYEYGFFWYLYLDGTIQMEVKLTGIVGVSAVAPGGGSDTAPLIAPQLASPVHQHLFCFRLDFELDGRENSVVEVNAEPLPRGPDNPNGTGFRSATTALTSEAGAKRDVDPGRSRYWKVLNPNVENRLGVPVAYKLLPQGSPTLLAARDSVFAQRAGFACHNLWVSAYDPAELGAAGDFTNLHPGGAGLPAYTAGDRPLENTDLVVWHTFGLTHSPRPEDWPVMPMEYCGFLLQPVGFFERNPALDVPPTGHCAT